jgi:hypothetical protein
VTAAGDRAGGRSLGLIGAVVVLLVYALAYVGVRWSYQREWDGGWRRDPSLLSFQIHVHPVDWAVYHIYFPCIEADRRLTGIHVNERSYPD